MSELRWNPLLGTWTMVAANRQNRPNMPKDWCPFCPGEGKKVPLSYRTFIYPNDFPALFGLEGNGIRGNDSDGIYQIEEASGACEVVLYSPDHYACLYDLSADHMDELVGLWAKRVSYYKQFPLVKYVFEFENRGPEVGVTMPHPHGQIYAYPFVPLKLETEMRQSRQYYLKTGRNLLEDMLSEERTDGRRVIFETKHFLVFLPHFTDYPYGVFIVAKDSVIFLDEMTYETLSELGKVLQDVTGMFDALFDRPFPYMMCFHQGAVNSPEWEGQDKFYRFHIEFYPPLRNANTIKYYASSEMGAWAAANTRLVEETAEELRQALHKYLSSK
jgi:UDPglucose--hexose-1-phosphate uridylyltransferase